MHVSKERISLGQTIAGNPIDIVSYTVAAPAKGKRVYIQSGIHGGEVTYWLQHRLFNFLREHMTAGEVVFVPFASPAAWEQRSYFYTHGKFDLCDGKDFNSHFPGKEDGSLHQRTAFQLAGLAKGSDLTLDLHTSRNSIPFCIYTREAYAPLVKELGLRYNYLDAEIAPDTYGSFDCAMDPAGIDNLCVECGSHDEYDAAKTDEVFAGILRLLGRMGLIDKRHTQPAGEAFFFASHKKIIIQESGFVRYDVTLGKPFRKGDTLFTLHRTAELGAEKPEVASEDGIAYKHAPTHIYRIGDETLHYIPLSALKPL
jgi:predicted deacylase